MTTFCPLAPVTNWISPSEMQGSQIAWPLLTLFLIPCNHNGYSLWPHHALLSHANPQSPGEASDSQALRRAWWGLSVRVHYQGLLPQTRQDSSAATDQQYCGFSLHTQLYVCGSMRPLSVVKWPCVRYCKGTHIVARHASCIGMFWVVRVYESWSQRVELFPLKWVIGSSLWLKEKCQSIYLPLSCVHSGNAKQIFDGYLYKIGFFASAFIHPFIHVINIYWATTIIHELH